MSLFLSAFKGERSPNLLPMPSLATTQYESGGVHLSAYSRLEFTLHLFDSSEDVLNGLELATDQVCSMTIESTRVLEDRVMVLGYMDTLILQRLWTT